MKQYIKHIYKRKKSNIKSMFLAAFTISALSAYAVEPPSQLVERIANYAYSVQSILLGYEVLKKFDVIPYDKEFILNHVKAIMPMLKHDHLDIEYNAHPIYCTLKNDLKEHLSGHKGEQYDIECAICNDCEDLFEEHVQSIRSCEIITKISLDYANGLDLAMKNRFVVSVSQGHRLLISYILHQFVPAMIFANMFLTKKAEQ